MSIIDTPFNTESKIPCLLSQGVQTVIRYYNFSNSRTLPEKRLELAEAQALAAQGIQIAAIFQQRHDRVEDFTASKGLTAGRRAYRHAQDNIGQPAGSGIYFAVDFDASRSELENNITPYFEGVKRAFAEESGGNPEYRIGAYGSGLVCTTLTEKGLIELTWLAMSRGFRGTREALSAGEFHLAQRAPAATLCGLGVDFNDSNPDRPDFGAFTIDDDTARPGPVATVGERHKVMARNGLRLREGPGTQFDIVGGLHPGQIVFVVSISDGWARVDVEGDGQVDGFASADFLERI
ncbi:MAG TPA: glycoside hydrolase domain-containing protein [Alphaproteobacteria bacterium]|nr:glycoside hydrolase domain-containing protein [Alphaproteobacteria bacterium]